MNLATLKTAKAALDASIKLALDEATDHDLRYAAVLNTGHEFNVLHIGELPTKAGGDVDLLVMIDENSNKFQHIICQVTAIVALRSMTYVAFSPARAFDETDNMVRTELAAGENEILPDAQIDGIVEQILKSYVPYINEDTWRRTVHNHLDENKHLVPTATSS